jgi:hypothetical protein
MLTGQYETLSASIRVLAFPAAKQKTVAGAYDPHSRSDRRIAHFCPVVRACPIYILDFLIT